ncbi:MAG TPA: hypothetical protein PKD86_03340 [Gemmatales bacterium]|nr:hypothetical protein [Gemmatales bacterium]
MMIRSLIKILALCGILLFGGQTVQAQVITFANFGQVNPNETPFTFVRNPSVSPTSVTWSVSTQITFNPSAAYRTAAQEVAAGFPMSGDIFATLTLNITSTQTGGILAGSVIQPMSSSSGSFSIIANAPINGLSNLLSASFRGTMSGNVSGFSVTFNSSTPPSINTQFNSAFVIFDADETQSFSMSMTGLNNAVDLVDNFMTAWQGSGTGVFSARITAVPEPLTMTLLGFTGAFSWLSRRWRRQWEIECQALEAVEGE